MGKSFLFGAVKSSHKREDFLSQSNQSLLERGKWSSPTLCFAGFQKLIYFLWLVFAGIIWLLQLLSLQKKSTNFDCCQRNVNICESCIFSDKFDIFSSFRFLTFVNKFKSDSNRNVFKTREKMSMCVSKDKVWFSS